MKNRYHIIETYNGLFDSTRMLAATDSLICAVHLVEHLKFAEENNPCYSFDFLKVDDTVNELDWFPGQTFDSFGKTINCKNYKEFLEQKP